MENLRVVFVAALVGIVAFRIIKKMKDKGSPSGGDQKSTFMNKGTNVGNIPDDYEPYSDK